MDKRLRTIAEYYGYDSQSRQLIEEMAELTQKINHLWRLEQGQDLNGIYYGFVNRNFEIDQAKDRVVDEIADVELCLEQVKYLLGLDKNILKESKDIMINRQLKRIKEEEKLYT